MTKFMKKLTGLALGLALITGVGVGVSAMQKESVEVNATSPVTLTTNALSGTSSDKNIGWSSAKGSSGTAPAIYNSAIRLYQNGGFIILDAKNGTKITGFTAQNTATYSSTANYAVSSTAFSTATTPDVAGTNTSVAASGTYSVSGLNDNYVAIICKGTSKSTRLEISSIVVTYNSGSVTEATAMTITPSSLTIYSGESASFKADLTGGSGAYEKTIGWVSNNTSLIPSPSNSEDGDTVSVTSTAGLTIQTDVTITGTVVSPGSATNSIVVTVKPERTISNVYLDGDMTKKQYNSSETKWNLSGLVLKATMSEGEDTTLGDAQTLIDSEKLNVTLSPTQPTAGSLTISNLSFTNDKGTYYSEESYSKTISGITVVEVSTFTKVTSDIGDWRGTYLIVSDYEDINPKVYNAFNGNLDSLDAANNFSSIPNDEYNSGVITASTTTLNNIFTIGKTDNGYYIKSNSGYYISNTNASNKLSQSNSKIYNNKIEWDSENNQIKIISLENTVETYLGTYGSSSSTRFRFYTSYFINKTGADGRAVALYKLNEQTSTINNANTFGSNFMTNVGGVCDPTGTQDNITSELWTAQATAFNALDVNAQGYLARLAGDTAGSNAQKAVSLYDYIISKYGSSKHTDFMNRIDSGKIVTPRYNVINGSNSDTTIAIVAVVSLIGVSAIGGYFFIRKTKHE